MQLDKNKVHHLDTFGSSEPIIKKDLKLSLKPILNWAKLVAVLPFTNDEAKATYKESKISLIFRYLAWFLAIAAHSSSLFFFLYSGSSSARFFSTGKGAGVFSKVTTNWKMLINSINWMVHTFGIHTIILLVFSKRLKTLLGSLERTNHQLQHLIDFAFIRKLSWIGVCYIFLSV